ncbi:MAG: DNA polymerase IV [Actinobacteria bacterium]|nr:DNA polymerase IV [Actinomycetota bacterium]
MKRQIVHLDMDAYFASIEQRDFPIYRGKPLLVCHTDDPTSNRGVVSAASYEARAYGVKSATTVLEARKRCPNGIFIAGNYDRYLASTREVIELCGRYSDIIEVYSIDEVFLDITGTERFFGGVEKAALSLQRAIRCELGLSASVGVGPSKIASKMASELSKPGGVSIVTRADMPDAFAPLSVTDIPGVGKRMSKHLDAIGIKTVGELATAPESLLKKKFGIVGLALKRAALGLDGSPVVSNKKRVPVKSFGHSSSLGHGVDEPEQLKKILMSLIEGATRRMRKDGYLGRTVNVCLIFARLFGVSHRRTLSGYTNLTGDVYPVAVDLMARESDNLARYPVTKIGVSVANLVDKHEAGRQLSIFDMLDGRESALTAAADSLRDKYGNDIVIRAAAMEIKRNRYHAVPKTELSLRTDPISPALATRRVL